MYDQSPMVMSPLDPHDTDDGLAPDVAASSVPSRTVLVVGRPGPASAIYLEAIERVGHRVLWRSAGGDVVHDPAPSVDAVVALPVTETLATLDEGSVAAHADHVVEIHRSSGAGRCVLVSGLAAGGPVGPGLEPVFEGGVEDAPLSPAGKALSAVEVRVRAELGHDVVVLRPGDVYDDERHGALGDLARLMFERPATVAAIWSDHRIAPIHRGDVGRAAALAAVGGQWLYHLSQIAPVTVADLVQVIAQKAVELEIPVPGQELARSGTPTNDRAHWRHPHHRAERELGFTNFLTLESTIEPIVVPVFASELKRAHQLDVAPLRWENRWWRFDPSTVASDLENATVTLRSIPDDVVVTVDASTFGPAGPPGPRSRDVRTLVEDAIRTGFSQRWVGLICDFAARQGLVRLAKGSGS